MTPDLNVTIANLIDDLAEIQESRQKQMGYRRAAHAILLLEQTITALIQPGENLAYPKEESPPRAPRFGRSPLSR